MNLLFVCGRNKRRSLTAATLYQNDPRFKVRSGGVSPKSRRKVTESDLLWADLVFVMERKHLSRLKANFPAATFQSVNLDIPDEFDYMDNQLIELLQTGIEEKLQSV